MFEIQKIDRLKSELALLKAKIDRINDGFANGAIDIVEFKEMKNPLIPKKVELDEQIVALEKSKANRLEPLRKWVYRANSLNTAVSSNDWLGMKSFLQEVGSNRLLSAQTLTVSFKKPFACLAETVSAVRDLTDDSARCENWWSRQGSNLRPPQCHCGALPTELRPQPECANLNNPAHLSKCFSGSPAQNRRSKQTLNFEPCASDPSLVL